MHFIKLEDERGPYFRVICDNGEFFVDQRDIPLVMAHNWKIYAHQRGRHHYVQYAKSGKIVMLHRKILDVPPHLFSDHRDGDGLNCRRYNLRLATPQQNAMNIRRTKGTSSGYRGVYKRKNGKGYDVIVSRKHKAVSLGNFLDPVEAARVRDAWVLAEYGEFAVLNFPAK